MSIDFPLISSGISGLDEILCGGFATARVYLIYGQPGSGKTMLGQHFLEAGLENDEIVLSIHGEESRSELLTSAAAVGIDLEGASFLDLGPESEYFTDEQTYDLVDPGEIERDKYTQEIYGAIRDVDPDRVVVDPITQLRYVQSSDGQFRRQILSFIRFLKEEGITVLAMATPSPEREYDKEIRSLSDGIVELEYGDGGRRIGVPKHRNIGQVDGKHGIEIRDDGIQVFPALVPEKHSQSIDQGQISGGIDELDELLGGGIERNTVTFISGPTGVGKSTLGA